jgi:hypothetical protein
VGALVHRGSQPSKNVHQLSWVVAMVMEGHLQVTSVACNYCTDVTAFGLPYHYYCRTKAGITKSQPGFFSIVVLPQLRSFVQVCG